MEHWKKIDKAYEEFVKKHDILFRMLCFVVSAVFALLFLKYLRGKNYQFFYSVNDDLYLREMLSGELYGGTGYTIMIKKWLGTVLASLYQWRPYTEWYALMILGGILASLMAFVYSVLIHAKKVSQVLLTFVCYLAFCLCFAEHFLVVTYTEVAAYLMIAATAIAYSAFCVYEERANIGLLAVELMGSILLGVLSMSLRTDSCIMMIPFAGILLLVFWRKARGQSRRICVLFVVVLVALWGMIYVHDLRAYTAVDGYENVRPLCEGTNPVNNYYGAPDYDQHKEFYDSIGMSERTYRYMSTFYYNFAEDFDLDQITAVGEYTLAIAPAKTVADIWENFKNNFLFANFFPLGMFALLFWVCGLLNAVWEKDRDGILLSGGIMLAYIVDALYLSYMGRLPDRVIVPLYVALMQFGIFSVCKGMAGGKRTAMVSGLVLALFFLTRGTVITSIQDEQGRQLTLFRRQETVYQYMAEHPENFYLISPYMHPTGGGFFYDKTQRSGNYAYYSDYPTYLPEWNGKLEENGIDSSALMESFVTNANVVIISPDELIGDYIEEYLQENHLDGELVQLDVLCGYFYVYNVTLQ